MLRKKEISNRGDKRCTLGGRKNTETKIVPPVLLKHKYFILNTTSSGSVNVNKDFLEKAMAT